MNFTISKEALKNGMDTMNAFGARLTGNKAHADFINWLKAEISKMDIPTT